jgi:hypothetical protein
MGNGDEKSAKAKVARRKASPHGAILARNQYEMGPGVRVLAILDPFNKGDGEIDLEADLSSDVTKSFVSPTLWILNSVNVYLSDGGSAWLPFRATDDGTLRRIIKGPGSRKEARRPWPFAKNRKELWVHFTSLPPRGQGACQKQCSSHKVARKLKLEEPNSSVLISYPKDVWSGPSIKFKQEDVCLLRVPLGKLNYVESTLMLNHWEQYIYQNAGGFGKYRVLEFRHELTTDLHNQLRQDIRKLLEPRASITVTVVGNVPRLTVASGANLNLDRDFHFFAFSATEDANREIKEKQEALKDPLEEEPEIAGKFVLHRLNRQRAKTAALNSAQVQFIQWGGVRGMGIYLANQEPRIKQTEDVVSLAREYLTMLFPTAGKSVVDKVMMCLHVGVGGDQKESLANALSSAISTFKAGMTSFYEDFHAAGGYDDSESLSATTVGFATGSDSLSESITPKHVYAQLEGWWDGLFDFQKDEIRKQVAAIDVIGYASRIAAAEEVNIRLRKNRAWKTATALSTLLLEKGMYFSDQPMAERKNAPTQVYMPDLSARVRPLYYGSAEEFFEPDRKYPDRGLVPAIGAMTRGVVEMKTLSEGVGTRANNDNDALDRVCQIVFRKVIPSSIEQVVKSVVITNSAYVIHRYDCVREWVAPDKTVAALYFVCPGRFDPGPP